MYDKKWTFVLAVSLIAVSVILYFLHLVIFHDPHHIAIYFLGELAFLPIEVLLVTLILHQLLERRDRQMKLKKLNMVIGTFFSTVGTDLLTYCSDHDPGMQDLRKDLRISESCEEADFKRVSATLKGYTCMVTLGDIDLADLKKFLMVKEDFMVRLLENPMLIEHESFTDLLQAVFHLTAELAHRKDLASLPANDQRHLSHDVCRAYHLLILQWLEYMGYQKKYYPYLFSFAVRTNPFDEQASVIIR